MISTECRAKINLYLYVLGKRRDGFHEIDTLFQEIDLADELVWRPDDQPMRLSVDGPNLGDPENNLVIRAAREFERAARVEVGGLFHLVKRIPVCAGLGGGSSDAAGTLRLLNHEFGRPLNEAQLAVAAAKLGSDVPFFLDGGCQLGRGRGELLSPAAPPPGPSRGFLLTPPVRLETAAVYRRVKPSLAATGSRRVGHNDLLPAALSVSPAFARVWRLAATLLTSGALFMSGSGSVIVWLAGDGELDKKARRELAAEGVAWMPFRYVAGDAGRRSSP